jgi:hypothetical protein
MHHGTTFSTEEILKTCHLEEYRCSPSAAISIAAPCVHQRQQLVVRAVLFQDHVVRDELFLRLRQQYLVTKLDGLPTAATHDQFRVWFEDAEHFVLIGKPICTFGRDPLHLRHNVISVRFD